MNAKTCVLSLVAVLAAAAASAKPSPLETKVRGAMKDVAGSSGVGTQGEMKLALEPLGLDPNDRSPDAMRARNDYWDAENKAREADSARSSGDHDRADRSDRESRDLFDRSDREIRQHNSRPRRHR